MSQPIFDAERVYHPAIAIGRISFTLPDASSVYPHPVPLSLLLAADEKAYIELSNIREMMERALHERFRQSFAISGGTVEPGSIKFRNGELVITGPALALLVIIQVISGYPDFREGVKQIVEDSRAVIEQVGSSAGAKDVIFDPADIDQVAAVIEPTIPQEVRDKIKK
ncbi:MAG: hypothetical protein E6Q77_04100 [Rhizobium sp.]|nr:MAG: hypothetical protein E6Q77_04100 [Rhizobium sp.]